jgi:hypothetical protein
MVRLTGILFAQAEIIIERMPPEIIRQMTGFDFMNSFRVTK